ncbi:hypothetical protein P2318_05925 [Myxococcaceae bacterium GXIMD 01537]
MRLVSLLPAWLCLSLAACSAPTFTAEVKGETTVAAAPILGGVLNAFPAIASFASLDFDQNQDFKNQGVTKDEVSSVKVRSLRLKVLSPDDADFGFLDSLEFFARAGDREVRIARKDNISRLGLSAPNPVLELDVEDVDLQPYVTAPSMSIIVRGKGRMPEKEVRLQASVLLEVKLSLL